MVSSCEQLVCDLGSVIPFAAMVEPVNEPVFGAREDEMGIVFAAFKTPAKQIITPPGKNDPSLNAG
jgi:hypothetical protein